MNCKYMQQYRWNSVILSDKSQAKNSMYSMISFIVKLENEDYDDKSKPVVT